MFLVIEGIDGAGCETQAKNLQKMIKNNDSGSHFPSESERSRDKQAGMTAFLVKYPDYEKNIGRLIKDFLYQNKDLDAEQQFLLYCLQFIFDTKWLKQKRNEGIVIADRYFSTTLCYQILEGIRLDKALRFAEDFKIEKPDLVFYLDVKPEIAIERKSGEDKEKNRREKDFEFIKKTYQQYDKLVKDQVWTKWIRINGERSVDEITKNIYDILKE